MSLLVPSGLNENFMVFLLELSVITLHSVDMMIQKLLDIFSEPHEISIRISSEAPLVQFTISVVGQSFHGYGSSLFHKSASYRCYFNPMTGKEMLFFPEIDFFPDIDLSHRYIHHPRYQHCGTGNMMSIVTEWYRCPKIRITTADAKFYVSNFSVCLVEYQTCISSLYFKELPNKRGIEICLNLYLEASKYLLTNSDDEMMKYLSVSCLSLSSLGSLLTFVTVVVSNSNKKLGEINIMILAAFSILANTVYTFSKFFLWNEILCISVGMLVHFSWLSVVCWMSLSTFQIFQTFTSFNNTVIKVRSRVLVTLMVDFFLCMTCIVINVSVSYMKSGGESFGYSPRTCYIADPEMTLYTFALPVGLMVSINTFMFVVTAFRIRGKTNIRKSKDQKKISSYFRLSTITGGTWLFGFLAQFTELQLFSVLHTVFSGGQGIFLYFAFGLSQTLKYFLCNQPQHSENVGKNTQ
jgi:hypothetical protein